MERGEVRWYAFAAPDKTRPVLILTRSSALRYLNSVTVAPLTTTIRGVPSEVFLDEDDGLARPSAVNCHNLQTIPQTRVGAWITTLTADQMAAVEQAIQFALGIDAS